jgi:hypothetical protein
MSDLYVVACYIEELYSSKYIEFLSTGIVYI